MSGEGYFLRKPESALVPVSRCLQTHSFANTDLSLHMRTHVCKIIYTPGTQRYIVYCD